MVDYVDILDKERDAVLAKVDDVFDKIRSVLARDAGKIVKVEVAGYYPGRLSGRDGPRGLWIHYNCGCKRYIETISFLGRCYMSYCNMHDID